MNLYLYGKREIIGGLLDGTVGLRFKNILTYKSIENEKIRDDEDYRCVVFPSDPRNSIQIGEYRISGDKIKRSSFRFPTRACFCLCLSKVAFSEELFERFDADICFEIHLPFLLPALNEISKNSAKGTYFLISEISYMSDFDSSKVDHFLPKLDRERSVFIKSDIFEIEREVRIAWFFPFDEKTIAVSGEVRIDVFNEPHIDLSFGIPGGIGNCIIRAQTRDGEEIEGLGTRHLKTNESVIEEH